MWKQAIHEPSAPSFYLGESGLALRCSRESTIDTLQPRQAGRPKLPTAAHETRHTEKAVSHLLIHTTQRCAFLQKNLQAA